MQTTTQDGPRVFISYSHDSPDHVDRVLAVADRLRADGIDCNIDQYEMAPSSGWARWTVDEIEHAEFVLIVCSEVYELRFKGNYSEGLGRGVKWEGAIITQALYESEGLNKKFIPLILTSSEQRYIPLVLRGTSFYDLSQSDGYEKLYRRLTDQPIVEKPDRGRLRRLPSLPRQQRFTPAGGANDPLNADGRPAAPEVWNVPNIRNPNFVGRTELLQDLDANLHSSSPGARHQAICGMGGVGKTQLALEYAYRHRGEYGVVWWLRADESGRLSDDYVALAQELKLPEVSTSDRTTIVETLRRHLERRDDWLLVFDNADDPRVVSDYLPRSETGHVLITSRNPDWKEAASSIKVPLWPRQDSIAYIMKLTNQGDGEGSDKMAAELGDLPLALAQAAAYIGQTSISISSYLDLFRTRRSDLMGRQRHPSDYPYTIATTWNLAIEKVDRASPAAAELLHFIAVLGSGSFERWRTHGDALQATLSRTLTDPLSLNEAIRVLRSFSMIDVAGESFYIHPLLRAVILDRAAPRESFPRRFVRWFSAVPIGALGGRLLLLSAALGIAVVVLTVWLFWRPAYVLGTPSLGALFDETGAHVTFKVRSAHASRIEVFLYSEPVGKEEKAHFVLSPDRQTDLWTVTVAVSDLTRSGLASTFYYGYRAWGPNWQYDPSWKKGSLSGFLKDVDADGNRFNPNKLLIDPYALELSHDTPNLLTADAALFVSEGEHRQADTGPLAPKGIVLAPDRTSIGARPKRAFKDEIIYEVHVRGFTRNDSSVPESERGTFAGAARKASYLKDLGVTAIELLPIQESSNDKNDAPEFRSTGNYWGYNTFAYLAPDRRYASEKAPGGPTREFKKMVRAFHDQGIKVYLDVVYNHTAEFNEMGPTVSWRGLDNASYYSLAKDRQHYLDYSGAGNTLNTSTEITRDLIQDSLAYWSKAMGVDGFRFDLASVLGRNIEGQPTELRQVSRANPMYRAALELPARPDAGGDGVDLIAEPWDVGGYLVGAFPVSWAEWNAQFRDEFRKVQNGDAIDSRRPITAALPPFQRMSAADRRTNDVTPLMLRLRFAGSPDVYEGSRRRPWHSVNYLVSHDGFTLRDLYSYNEKQNGRPWPYGVSLGGNDTNFSWDQDGDPRLQRQAARNGFAFPLLSAGVPMFTGGDEMYRTQFGNNNPYNLDSEKIWVDWQDRDTYRHFYEFARRIISFRRDHPALRPMAFWTGTDHNGNGLKDVTWHMPDGTEATEEYFKTTQSVRFLSFRIDGSEFGDSAASIYIAYNAAASPVDLKLPTNLKEMVWKLAGDTADRLEKQGNFNAPGAEELVKGTYSMAARTVSVFIEKK